MELGPLVALAVVVVVGVADKVFDSPWDSLAEESDLDFAEVLAFPPGDFKFDDVGDEGPLGVAAAGGVGDAEPGHDVDEEDDGCQQRHLHDDLQQGMGDAASTR